MEGKVEVEQQNHGGVVGAEKDVRFWSNKVQDLTEKLEKWWEDNPDSTGEEQRYQFLERSLTKANESLNEANKRLKEANERLDKERAYHLQLLAAQKPPEQTVSGHKRIPDDKWFTQNMITKKLKVDHDEIKYFEMSKFPPIAHPNYRNNKIIERKCYVTIFESLMEKIKNIFKRGSQANLVVTGNPGVGKSRFYLYCIFRLIRDQVLAPDVHLVINFDTEYHKYCFIRKEFLQLNEDEVFALQQSKNVLRLVEAKSSRLVGWTGVSILFSLPGLSGLNNFMKVNTIRYILPVWSFEELLEYNSLLDDDLKLSNDVLSERYDKYGGIPRFIFEKNGLYEAEMGRAISSFIYSYNMGCAVRRDVEAYDCDYQVFQMVPDRSDFRYSYHLDFLSKYTGEQVITRLKEKSLEILFGFVILHWNDELKNTSLILEKIYKLMCHRRFELSKPFKLNFRSLCTGTSDFELTVPAALEIVHFNKLEDIKVEEIPEDGMTYYQPTSHALDALDAIIMDTISFKCYGLQMTTDKDHGIKAEPMELFLDWLAKQRYHGHEFEFCCGFIVPSEISGEFEEQKFKNKDGSVRKELGETLRKMEQFVAPFDPFSHKKK